MADQPSQTLGKYKILQELGKGGFATVYRALDTTLDREVALKVLNPLLMRDETWVARFRHEARAVARLKQPHIVHIYEVGEAEGRLFITMESIEGPPLNELIAASGRLAWEKALDIVTQIADALDYAHGEGIVHRDLKPSNVLFDPRLGVVLTDFGFAKLVGESSMSISVSGGIVGTPAYIAPEVWEGKEAVPATDVYALGCVLFEMLTGAVLFKGDTPPAVMMGHFQPHQYPEEWPEGVPPQARGLLEKALARDPADRYPSAGAFVADLKNLTVKAADPFAGPYQALQEALAAEQWERALALAGEITAQDPGYRDVSALAQRAAEGQAEAERARWAAQWREQALAAEGAGQRDAARAAAGRWLELTPGDPEAQALVERLTADPLAGPYQALQEALAAGEWERALALAGQITAQDPDYRDVSALAQRATEGRAQAERAQQVARWREEALAAERAGQRDTARVAAGRWLELAPGDPEAQALLERLTPPPPLEPPPEPEVVPPPQPERPAPAAEVRPRPAVEPRPVAVPGPARERVRKSLGAGGLAALAGVLLIAAFFMPWIEDEWASLSGYQILKESTGLGSLNNLLQDFVTGSTALAGLGSVIFGLALAAGSPAKGRSPAFRAWTATGIGAMVVWATFWPCFILSIQASPSLGDTLSHLRIGLWLSLCGAVSLAITSLRGLLSARPAPGGGWSRSLSGYGGALAVLLGMILLVGFFLPWGEGESAFDAVTQDVGAVDFLSELLVRLIFASTGLAGLGSVIFGLLLARSLRGNAAYKAWAATSIGGMAALAVMLPGFILSSTDAQELGFGLWITQLAAVLLPIASLMGLLGAFRSQRQERR
jgi:predicted Ser/Thr protein kinase